MKQMSRAGEREKVMALISQGKHLLFSQVLFERRILLGCTAIVGLSTCIWSVAIGTDHWYGVEAPNDQGLPLGGAGKAGRRLLYKHMGLWRGCIDGLVPESENSTELVPYSECVILSLEIYTSIRSRGFCHASSRSLGAGLLIDDVRRNKKTRMQIPCLSYFLR